MNIDKGLIKHWAMLFESDEMKTTDGFSDVFSDDEPKTMDHKANQGVQENQRGGYQVALLNSSNGDVKTVAVQASSEEEAREKAQAMLGGGFDEIGQVRALDDMNMDIRQFKKDVADKVDGFMVLQNKLNDYVDMLGTLGKQIPKDIAAYKKFFDTAADLFYNNRSIVSQSDFIH